MSGGAIAPSAPGCGLAARRREAIKECEDAGFDHVFIHQIGPDPEGFFTFYESEILAASAPARGQEERGHVRTRPLC
jgi:hypothetical protein